MKTLHNKVKREKGEGKRGRKGRKERGKEKELTLNYLRPRSIRQPPKAAPLTRFASPIPALQEPTTTNNTKSLN